MYLNTYIIQLNNFQDVLSGQTRHLKAVITKTSIKDKLEIAYSYLEKLKDLCEDVRIPL